MIVIIDPTNKKNYYITKSKGATAPARLIKTFENGHKRYHEYDRMCGYWEDAFELINWAYDVAHFDIFNSFYIYTDDSKVRTYDDVEEEHFEKIDREIEFN